MPSTPGTDRDAPTGWRADAPYDDLPPLPPSADLETRSVLRRTITARAALAELKQAAALIPNQAMLIAALPMLEARASSEIENVVTTADALFRSLTLGTSNDPATREALRYREALLEGFRSIASVPLGTRTAEAIATRIKDVDTRVRRYPGTVLRNDRTGATIYTPPAHESRLRTLLGNWERFMHADDELDPLIRMAVGHYQFEAIHPFSDGNGRTGRILNILFLVERGLIDAPLLYLSRHIISHKTTYYQRLLAVTAEGAWEPWITFMLEAVEETARWTLEKVSAIRDLHSHTTDFVRERLGRADIHDLLALVFERPYCRIVDVVDRGIAQRQTASKRLHELAEIGVLEPTPHGRHTLFVHTRLLHLLTTDGNAFERYG
jgi:Fic family protein